jgi:hypothetical protein
MSDDIDYLLDGDPRETIRWQRKADVWGDPVVGSRATIAQLEDTDQKCIAKYGHGVEILQGCFNTDVPASAGTHDFDRCVDMFIPRVDWLESQRFLRSPCLWMAWFRQPPTFSSKHIHGVASHRFLTRVGEFVPGQMDDYLATPPRSGLKGHVVDSTWHPTPIVRFDYVQWKAEQMAVSDADIAKIAAAAADKAVTKILASEIVLSNGEKVTVQLALRRAAQMPDALDAAQLVLTNAVDVSGKSTNTKVVNSRNAIMAKLDEIDTQVGP